MYPGRRLRVCIVSSEFVGPYRNGGIGTAYGDWDSNNQNLWVPNDPVGP